MAFKSSRSLDLQLILQLMLPCFNKRWASAMQVGCPASGLNEAVSRLTAAGYKVLPCDSRIWINEVLDIPRFC